MYRHWQPVLRMYITPFMTARMSTRRLPPPRLAGWINGSTYPFVISQVARISQVIAVVLCPVLVRPQWKPLPRIKLGAIESK
jgi:hypothetical protein